MFFSISMSSEILSRDSVGTVHLTRGRKKCDAFHFLEETVVRQAVPVLVFGIRLQILRVTCLTHCLKNAELFRHFWALEVPVVSRQIVVHDVAHFMQR